MVNNESGPVIKINLDIEDKGEKNETRRYILENKEYLKILETYPVNWDFEKISRDIWQNFFDANIDKEGRRNLNREDITINDQYKDGIYDVLIKGKSSYDIAYLQHLGATNKDNGNNLVFNAAGGFGEGAKIVALQLLRDYQCDHVEYASGNWKAVFTLDTLDDQNMPSELKDVRGLHLNIYRTQDPIKGSYMRFGLKNDEQLDIFKDSRNLFYSKENPDFQNATFENKYGGFKYIPGEKGNFYFNGQRINVGFSNNWNTINDLNLWINSVGKTGPKIDLGRDRKRIDVREIEQMLPYVTKEIDEEDSETLLLILQENWVFKKEIEIDGKLIKSLTDNIKSKKMAFDEDCVAVKNQEQADYLKVYNYNPCLYFFSDIGMKDFWDVLEELGLKDVSKEISEKEREKINIMKDAMSDFIDFMRQKQGNKENVILRNNILEKIDVIKIYDSNNKRFTNIGGQYQNGELWIGRDDFISSNFEDTWKIFIHEICHVCGADESAEFSYALTEMIGYQASYFLEKSDYARDIVSKWNKKSDEIISENINQKVRIEEKIIPIYHELSQSKEQISSELDNHVMSSIYQLIKKNYSLSKIFEELKKNDPFYLVMQDDFSLSEARERMEKIEFEEKKIKNEYEKIDKTKIREFEKIMVEINRMEKTIKSTAKKKIKREMELKINEKRKIIDNDQEMYKINYLFNEKKNIRLKKDKIKLEQDNIISKTASVFKKANSFNMDGVYFNVKGLGDIKQFSEYILRIVNNEYDILKSERDNDLEKEYINDCQNILEFSKNNFSGDMKEREREKKFVCKMMLDNFFNHTMKFFTDRDNINRKKMLENIYEYWSQ